MSFRLRHTAFLAVFLLEFMMTRPVNAAGMAIADVSEGCVLHTYLDPVGKLSGGYGHTGPDLPPLGSPITQAQADAWQAQDMANAAAFVDAHVHVPLTDNQFSVLAEWTYNVGVGSFLGSTLLRKLNAGNYTAVPAQLMRWTKAGGKIEPGLVIRRQKEVALWNTPHSVPSIILAKDEPSVCGQPAPKPQPPSLIETIRAWFHRNAQVPA